MLLVDVDAPMIDFTVAVVTHDRAPYLDELLDSLADQDRLPEEILIVNNGDNEETNAVVRRHQSAFDELSVALRTIARPESRNLPAGRNTALANASGDVICFLDDDTIAKSSWLEGIECGYQVTDDVVAVGGPSIEVDKTLTPQYDILRKSENMNPMNRYGEVTDNTKRWIPPDPVRTNKLQGSNMSFYTDILEDISGFDPGYKGHPVYEDTDVMAKLWKRDETVIYHPDAMVYHQKASAGGFPGERGRNRYRYWKGRNSIRYRKHNFPETYPVSLLRLLLYTSHNPPPVWMYLGATLLTLRKRYLWQIAGYIDGVRKE